MRQDSHADTLVFERFEAFKTMDEVDSYLGGSSIVCLICDGYYQALGNHLRLAHAWDCASYKLHYGIPKTRKLVSDRLHQKLSALSEKMMAARGTEWEVNFKERGREFHGGRKGQHYTPVPATVRKLRQNQKMASLAAHAKLDGKIRLAQCPDCGTAHHVPAVASYKSSGVCCPSCLRIRTTGRELKRRGSPERIAQGKKRTALRDGRIRNGEIISTLAGEIRDYIAKQDNAVTTAVIIEAIWPAHPGIARVNFKKRISELLRAEQIIAVRPGLYEVPSRGVK